MIGSDHLDSSNSVNLQKVFKHTQSYMITRDQIQNIVS